MGFWRDTKVQWPNPPAEPQYYYYEEATIRRWVRMILCSLGAW